MIATVTSANWTINPGNFPVTSDAVRRTFSHQSPPGHRCAAVTINLQKAPRNSLQACDILLNTGLPNRTHIKGRLNTAVTPLITVVLTSKSVCKPHAGLVSKPFKHPNADGWTASYCSNFKGFPGTYPSLVSVSAASLPSSNCSNVPCDLMGAVQATAGCLSSLSRPDTCPQQGYDPKSHHIGDQKSL